MDEKTEFLCKSIPIKVLKDKLNPNNSVQLESLKQLYKSLKSDRTVRDSISEPVSSDELTYSQEGESPELLAQLHSAFPGSSKFGSYNSFESPSSVERGTQTDQSGEQLESLRTQLKRVAEDYHCLRKQVEEDLDKFNLEVYELLISHANPHKSFQKSYTVNCTSNSGFVGSFATHQEETLKKRRMSKIKSSKENFMKKIKTLEQNGKIFDRPKESLEEDGFVVKKKETQTKDEEFPIKRKKTNVKDVGNEKELPKKKALDFDSEPSSDESQQFLKRKNTIEDAPGFEPEAPKSFIEKKFHSKDLQIESSISKEPSSSESESQQFPKRKNTPIDKTQHSPTDDEFQLLKRTKERRYTSDAKCTTRERLAPTKPAELEPPKSFIKKKFDTKSLKNESFMSISYEKLPEAQKLKTELIKLETKLEALNSELEDKDLQLNEAKSKLHQVKTQKDEKETELENFKLDSKITKTQLEKENQKLKSDYESLLTKMHKLKEKLKEAQNENQKLNSFAEEYQIKYSYLAKSKTKTEMQLKSKATDKKLITEENKKLKIMIEELQTENQKLEQRIEELSSETPDSYLLELESLLQKAQNENGKLNEELLNKQKELSDLSSEHSELLKKCKQINSYKETQQLLLQRNQELELAKQKENDKILVIQDMEAQIEQLQVEFDSEKRKHSEVLQKYYELKNNYEEVFTNSDDSGKIKSLSKKTQKYSQENSKLKDQISDYQQKLAQKENKIKDSTKTIFVLEKNLKNFSQEKEKLARHYQNKLSDLKTQLSSEKAKNQKLIKKVDKLQKKLSNYEASLETISTEGNRKDSVAESIEFIKEFISLQTSRLQKINQKRQFLEDYFSEVNFLTAENQEFLGRIEDLQKEVSMLEEQNSLSEKNVNLEKLLSNKTEEVEMLKSEIQKLKETE